MLICLSVPCSFHCQIKLDCLGSSYAGLTWGDGRDHSHRAVARWPHSHIRQVVLAFYGGHPSSPPGLSSFRLKWASSHDGGNVPKDQNPNVEVLIKATVCTTFADGRLAEARQRGQVQHSREMEGHEDIATHLGTVR